MIRQNRDTLYSIAIVDVGSDGVALEIPEMGDRYISVMVINQDTASTRSSTARARTS